MATTSFWKNNILGKLLKNILWATIITVVLVWIMLYFTDVYTRHDTTAVVPNVVGMQVEEATTVLSNSSMNGLVVDSVFLRNKRLGAVVEQIPIADTDVKPNRNIYLVINSRQIRKVVLPQLVDISLRQAKAQLASLGLRVGEISYVSSEFKDLVIEVIYEGRNVVKGDKIPDGGQIDLIVGSGYNASSKYAPNLIGLNINEVNGIIDTSPLRLGAIIYDVEPVGDETDYVVYKQSPRSDEEIMEGATINIWLSKDKAKMEQSNAVHTSTHIGTSTDYNTSEGDNSDEDIEDFF